MFYWGRFQRLLTTVATLGPGPVNSLEKITLNTGVKFDSDLEQPFVEEWDRLKYVDGRKQFFRSSIQPIWQDRRAS